MRWLTGHYPPGNIQNMTTKFRAYFLSMDQAERDTYAKRAGTTAYYIQTHLISIPPRKMPRDPLMRGLAAASEGELSMGDVLQHFYGLKTNAA